MRILPVLAAIGLMTSAAWAEVPVPNGYRMDNYRAPTPAVLPGARVIHTAEAQELWAGRKTVFVDAAPAVLGTGVHAGKWLPVKARNDIPGSVWLPNVGYGELSTPIEAYFRTNLARLSAGGQATLVFYCLADCWMSWNAARRALSWGIPNVVWYPEGTDGWAEAHLPLETATPVPIATKE